MKYLLIYSLLMLSILACNKKKTVEPQNKTIETTQPVKDTLIHRSIIKLQVDGNSSPDSVYFISNKIYNIYGQLYFKRFINPNLTLLDSDFIFSKSSNDLSIIVYSSDNSKVFTSKIYINNTLMLQQTGQTNSISKKFITTYIY